MSRAAGISNAKVETDEPGILSHARVPAFSLMQSETKEMIMNRNIRPCLYHIVLGALALSLAAACVGPDVKVYERPDGTTIVESTEVRATVSAVDSRARTITLKRRFHEAQTFKADKSMVNFNQIQVGDEVHAVVVEEFAVNLVPGGAPPLVGEGAAVALAPEGSKPAIVMAETVGVTAEIIAIDSHSHEVVIEFPDRSTKTVKVGKHIDLTSVSLGDSVFIQITEAVAIEVVKP